MTPQVAGRGAVRERVEALLGPEAIGGRGAREPGAPPVALPSSAEETAALLRIAREEGWRVHPIGRRHGRALLAGPPAGAGSTAESRATTAPGATRTPGTAPALTPGAAPAPAPADLWIGSDRRSGVVEYEPADLTVRAGAGTELFALAELLAAEGQWLPLDPPGGRLVTLGGAFATGTPGPLAVQYGAPRDLALGMTLVDGGARVLALGGRVVKNVAGFDLVRLAVGSRGRLGVIDELSLRVFPLPPADRILHWRFERAADAFDAGWAMARLPLGPFPVEVSDGEWQNEWELRARLLGSGAAVDRLERELRALAGEPSEESAGAAALARADARARAEAEGAPVLEIEVPPERGGALLELLAPLRRPGGGRAGLRVGVELHTGRARARGGEGAEVSPGLLAPLAQGIAALGGRAELRVAPPAGGGSWLAHFGASPRPAAVRRIEARIFGTFDPHGVLVR